MPTEEEIAAMNSALGTSTTDEQKPQGEQMPTQSAAEEQKEPEAEDSDIPTLKAKIDLMSKQLTDIDSKIDEEFYGKLDTLLSDDEKELRFADDGRGYLEAVEAKRKAYISEQKKALEDELQKLTSEYGSKKESAEIKAIQKSFLAKYPDANLKEMQEWMQNDVSPRQQAEIQKDVADLAGYLEAVYTAFKAVNPSKKQETPKQPPNFTKENTTAAIDPTVDVEDKTFKAAIGLGD